MSECKHEAWQTFNGGKFCRCAQCGVYPATEITALQAKVKELEGQNRAYHWTLSNVVYAKDPREERLMIKAAKEALAEMSKTAERVRRQQCQEK
ncbi:hypothetical protein RE428_32330 [Marinobacter nanhaiticus D15-8W]|uniref:Uncharacterized protein n=1 Tax=Marinobacter nanhaiticus D15-8W TaxID=626887 RepID=N6X709_9GAMM|nr:hypothetical protein [Marinobacter nanhaiticus]ENO16923.1 hypothetical protein J057_01925 [Marinobacter nanhaiticus D15-8W]BES72215.1 hypothetical protein RE428_32330 [Marinobacter nanhaiticus D15-8W]